MYSECFKTRTNWENEKIFGKKLVPKDTAKGICDPM